MNQTPRTPNGYDDSWYRDKEDDRSRTWRLLGSRNKTQQCMMFAQGFILRVDVYDAVTGQEASATFYVEYLGGGPKKKILLMK